MEILEKIINEVFAKTKISIKPLTYNYSANKKLTILDKLRLIASDKMIDESIFGFWKICNAAIHGEPVTNYHINFVKDVSIKLLEYLEMIKNKYI